MKNTQNKALLQLVSVMFDKDWKTKATCALTQLVIRKKSCTHVLTPVFGIPQTCQLSALGLILQDNC